MMKMLSELPYTGFDIISDHVVWTSQPCNSPHAPFAMPYLAAMQMEC